MNVGAAATVAWQGTVDSNLKGPKQVSQIYTQGP